MKEFDVHANSLGVKGKIKRGRGSVRGGINGHVSTYYIGNLVQKCLTSPELRLKGLLPIVVEERTAG
jgi:hypothetical protein